MPYSGNDLGLKRDFAVSPPESRTEGGRRQGREGQQYEGEPGGDSWGARFLPSPLLYGHPENGKIVRQEQFGVPLGFGEPSPGFSKSVRQLSFL